MSSDEITAYSIQVDLEAMIETDARVQRVDINFLLYENHSILKFFHIYGGWSESGGIWLNFQTNLHSYFPKVL